MFPPLGSEPGNGQCPHVPGPPVQPTTRKSAKLITGIVVLPLPLSADGSVSISSRLRDGSVAAGHVLPKRWLSAVGTVPNEPVQGLPFVVLQVFPLNVPAVSSHASATG